MNLPFKLALACFACIVVPTSASADQANKGPIAAASTIEEIKAFFASQGKLVLTFVGFSGAGYESPERMLIEAGAVLDAYLPDTTIVNIGATAEGIGGVYEIAKKRGFMTTGIVSTQARDNDVALARDVDHVFYVQDSSWGGIVSAMGRLSPTSQAMVDVSDVVVGIGGGDVARDEMAAALQMTKKVRYIAADMNHGKAIDAARSKGLPAPSDFCGSAGLMFRR